MKSKGRRPYAVALLAGAILTPFAIWSAAVDRGYRAVGGEYLLIPLLLLLAYLWQNLTRDLKGGKHRETTHSGPEEL